MSTTASAGCHHGFRNAVLSGAIALTVVGTLLAPAAFAAQRRYAYVGTISSYYTGNIDDYPIGTAVRFEFEFDDDPSQDVWLSDPTKGHYGGYEAWIAIDGLSGLRVAGSDSTFIEVFDDFFDTQYLDGIRIGSDSDPGFPTVFEDVPAGSGNHFYSVNTILTLSEYSASPSSVLVHDAPPWPAPAASDFTATSSVLVDGIYPVVGLVAFYVEISEFGEPGSSATLPIIPHSIVTDPDGRQHWSFATLGIGTCASGCWIDPPFASSFTYAMTNSALFTQIVDFPPGFGDAIGVRVGGSSLGTYGPGDSVDFTSYPGGGVSSFEITGLVPGADLSTAAAFPLRLAFDSADSQFTMTSGLQESLPVLAWPAVSLLASALTILGWRRLRS